MKKMIRKFNIYLSIPISGQENTLIERTKKAKVEILQLFISKGYSANDINIVLPVDFNEEGTTLEDFLGGKVENYEEKDYAWFMGQDIENLLRCDAIYLARDWESSKGCTAEKAVAEIYRLEIFSYSDYKDIEF